MLHKVFVILGAIAYKKVNTIDAISTATGIPRSSVHRLLQMLIDEDVVSHEAKRGFVLTPKLLSIGLRGIAEREMLDIAIPIMRYVSDVTRETVSINVICAYERVCVYRIEGNHPITRHIRIGTNAPLFRGSAGKVIASGLTRREQERILERYVADGTFRADEIPNLLRDADIVKQQGYAISIGERVKGSASIAVPIKDMMNNVIAALSISALEERLHPENRRKYLDLLLDASRQIQEHQFFGC